MDVEDPHPLAQALWARDFSLARSIVEAGASLDEIVEDDGNSFLHVAAETGDTDMLDFYLSYPCPRTLEQFDHVDRTPLICAAERGQKEVVERLLAVGANPNTYHEEQVGNTAILEAVRGGYTDIVALLLEAGADPTIPSWMHISAVDQAWYDIRGEHETIREIRLMLQSYPSSLRDRVQGIPHSSG